jgi:membrane protein
MPATAKAQLGRGRLTSFATLISLLKQSANVFMAVKAPSRGGAIAFYTITSLAPVLLIVIATAGFVFGDDAARGAVFAQFDGLLGTAGADILENVLVSVSKPAAGIFATVIGTATVLLTASGVFLELEDTLNEMWGVKKQSGTLTAMVRARLASLGLVIGLGFLLIVSLAIEAGLHALNEFINAHLPFGATLLLIVNYALTFVLYAVLFAAIYKFLPAKPLSWRQVLFGAALTAVLFQVGKVLIGLYLGREGTQSSLGAAGAFLALLFWIYYSSQIFLFGAALTKANFDRHAPKA